MTNRNRISAAVALLVLVAPSVAAAFQLSSQPATTAAKGKVRTSSAPTELSMSSSMDRRRFGHAIVGAATTAGSILAAQVAATRPANAQVFFDPAQYGDQELRVSAVDSVKESVRRAILQKPSLAPSFYQLSLLDGLSYNAQTQEFGPDGSVMKVVLSVDPKDEYTSGLREAALALIEAEKKLRQKNAVSLPDAIAIGGAEAIESVGGPVLPVQLGRADTPKGGRVSDLPLDIFSGRRSNAEVAAAFRQAGLTEREMTALLGGLLTLEAVEKTRSVDDWKASARPKFREAGKLGRMSDFKKLTDEDIEQAELDSELEDPDEGWYIADSFGTRESRFGERVGSDNLNEKTFNKFLKELYDASKKKGDVSRFGWIGAMLLDSNFPTAQSCLQKYASSNLNYNKDLAVAFNAVTQLGAVYTGGKYESLLKGKPRKSLNDDEMRF